MGNQIEYIVFCHIVSLLVQSINILIQSFILLYNLHHNNITAVFTIMAVTTTHTVLKLLDIMTSIYWGNSSKYFGVV